jgi:hypothetical protein
MFFRQSGLHLKLALGCLFLLFLNATVSLASIQTVSATYNGLLSPTSLQLGEPGEGQDETILRFVITNVTWAAGAQGIYNLFEPTGALSDRLMQINENNQAVFYFASDAADFNQLPTLASPDFTENLTEPGPFSRTSSVSNGGTITVIFSSDLEEQQISDAVSFQSSPVPEPSAFPLLMVILAISTAAAYVRRTRGLQSSTR